MDLLNYTLSLEEKSMEHYEFVRNHFDFPVDIDFKNFSEDKDKYVVGVRLENDSPLKPLIAVSIFSMLDDKINIDYVSIDKEYRKKGINKTINCLIEEIATANYIDYLTANIRESNINSINSFLKCGFEVCEDRKFKYKNGDPKIHVFKKLPIHKQTVKFKYSINNIEQEVLLDKEYVDLAYRTIGSMSNLNCSNLIYNVLNGTLEFTINLGCNCQERMLGEQIYTITVQKNKLYNVINN
jgi:ribosomal protein S18 acetylase RimI-like enzyme